MDENRFDQLNSEIDKLLAKLERKGVCPCCAASTMMVRGAMLYRETVSSDEAADLCDEIAEQLREDVADEDVPARGAQH